MWLFLIPAIVSFLVAVTVVSVRQRGVIVLGTINSRTYLFKKNIQDSNRQITVSADQWRDKNKLLYFKFATVLAILELLIQSTKQSDKKVVLFTSSPRIAILFSKIGISLTDFRVKRSENIAWAKDLTDNGVMLATPQYFQHLPDDRFSGYFSKFTAGAERGRAVLLYELERYPYGLFRPE